MGRRLGLAGIWMGLVVYAFGFAPPDQPDTLALIQKLSTGQWQGINPAVVALFNLMGIWPLVYGALALVDGHGQRVPAWPFVLGSFGLGAFVLLPYLVLRQPQPTFTPPLSRVLAVVEARWFGGLLWVAAIALMGYGVYAGDWADFIGQWQSSRFIHVMSLDFCLLWLLIPTLLGDDMARRGLKQRWLGAIASAIPLLGITAYLALRPPLPKS